MGVIRAGLVGVSLAASSLGLLRFLPISDNFDERVSDKSFSSASQEFNSKKVREELALRHQRLSRTPPTSPRNKFDTRWLNGELSSDHAGETGAVWIYEGALDAMKVNSVSAEVARGFVLEHLQAERRHLELIEAIVPDEGRTSLIPIWRIAGWLLGVFPTLVGPGSLFVTVQAVETFVERHYKHQIDPLVAEGMCPELVRLLVACCEDEVHHKEDAAERALDVGVNPGLMVDIWKTLVEAGSAAAAEVARRV